MDLLKQIKDIYNLSKGFSYCRGKIEIREKRADKEIIQKIQKRKKKIGSADKSAEQSNTKCAHDAVAQTLGVNSKQLADATGLAASEVSPEFRAFKN